MTEKQRKTVYGMAVAVFLLFCLAVCWFIGVPMVRMARDPELFREWVDTFGVGSRLVFSAMVMLQVIVALIPGEPLELAGGYAFGRREVRLRRARLYCWLRVRPLHGSLEQRFLPV